MAKIVLEAVSKRFGGDVLAVDDVSLSIEDGEFMVLVGPSGCGKSTILRMIAGLEDVTAGEVYIGERCVTDLPPKDRDLAMVFQNYALYPHMSVEQNLAFGLRMRGTARAEINQRVQEAAHVLGLEQLLQRKPAALSGGQRQRVAMGRAMVREPLAFLMDEPLSNLDAKLRVQMRAELARLRDRLKTTTVYVTHDQVEAMTLGDRVAVLKDGALQQVDTPSELFNHPANLFVAAFMGSPSMNLVEAHIEASHVTFGPHSLPLPSWLGAGYDRRQVILGIRPSDLEDAEVWPRPEVPCIEVTAEVTEDLGSEVNVLFSVEAPPVAVDQATAPGEPEELATPSPLLAAPGRSSFTARVDPRTQARPGRRIKLSVDPERFHLFDSQTGLAIVGPTASAAPGRLQAAGAR
jgi:multiple sugar transport system ATP-binding protein